MGISLGFGNPGACLTAGTGGIGLLMTFPPPRLGTGTPAAARISRGPGATLPTGSRVLAPRERALLSTGVRERALRTGGPPLSLAAGTPAAGTFAGGAVIILKTGGLELKRCAGTSLKGRLKGKDGRGCVLGVWGLALVAGLRP
ncbi:MAG: hypothetical protein LBF41_08410, partial [Deltaproteobacteria bacterium]|nr:hypothetical protein [Deltaproteobacteria bacterium]